MADFALRTASRVATVLADGKGEGETKTQGQQAKLDFQYRHPEFRDLPTFHTDLSGKRIEAKLSIPSNC